MWHGASGRGLFPRSHFWWDSLLQEKGQHLWQNVKLFARINSATGAFSKSHKSGSHETAVIKEWHFHTGVSTKPAFEKLPKLKVAAVSSIRGGDTEHVRRGFRALLATFSCRTLAFNAMQSLKSIKGILCVAYTSQHGETSSRQGIYCIVRDSAWAGTQ